MPEIFWNSATKRRRIKLLTYKYIHMKLNMKGLFLAIIMAFVVIAMFFSGCKAQRRYIQPYIRCSI